MTEQTKTEPTQGAIRAARTIGVLLREAHSDCPIDQNSLADMIDQDIGERDLLKALYLARWMIRAIDNMQVVPEGKLPRDFYRNLTRIDNTLAKAERTEQHANLPTIPRLSAIGNLP